MWQTVIGIIVLVIIITGYDLKAQMNEQKCPDNVISESIDRLTECYRSIPKDNISLVKCAEANISDEFIRLYNPKKVYCITFKTAKSTISGKDGYVNMIALVRQTGSIGFIDYQSVMKGTYNENRYQSPDTFVEKCRKRWDDRWSHCCPYEKIGPD